MGRKCSFFECKATTGLHAFPKNRDTIVLWLRAMGRSVTTTNTTGLFACNKHFNPESYENYGIFQMGLIVQSQLRVKEDAVPNAAYFVLPSNSPKACQDMGCQTEPTTKEVGCQTSPSTRDIGFQYHKKPERRSKTTQVILRVKEKASSTDPAITLVQVLPLAASTPISTPASISDLSSLASPAKRPRTEDDPDYRLEETGSSAYNDSTITDIPPQTMRKFIVYEENLMELFRKCPVCSRSCTPRTRTVGTLLHVEQKCGHCDYHFQWDSQPYAQNIPAGNLQLAAAVLFTGSSFLKVEKFMKAFHIVGICHTTYLKHQRRFLFPAINWHWAEEQRHIIREAIAKGDVILGGDMRCDSPGYCAKYGTYSVMDLRANKMIDIQLVQSNEVGNSQRMEKEGLIRSLDHLKKNGMSTIKRIVTDRHSGVAKFLKSKPEIDHRFDPWHMGKGVGKKIDALAKTRGCKEVGPWKKGVVNHMYWCGSSSSSGREIVAKWKSVANHVQNVHSHDNEDFPECLHLPLVGDQARQWLKPSTAACEKLTDIIKATRLLKDMEKMSTDFQTSSIESYHSIILKFAPKSVAFSFIGMMCRTQLAAVHYNENSKRIQATTREGELRWHILYPRYKQGDYSVRPLKTNPTFKYVDELQDLVFDAVLDQPETYQDFLRQIPVPADLCSQFYQPDKQEAVARHTSRFFLSNS